jgi:hypothetical protein
MTSPPPAAEPPVRAVERCADAHTVLMIVASAMFMEQLDGTVLATALPTMARSFDVDPSSPTTRSHMLMFHVKT